MTTTTPSVLLEQLNWRYATKLFDKTKKIPADVWQTLERALVLSPSSFGLQLWRFIVVNDPALRAKLRPVSWNQPQIEDASHLIVFAAKKTVETADVEKHLANVARVRSVPVESLNEYKSRILGALSTPPGGKGLDVWTSKQCYVALGVFLSTAAALGVDTCPMEGLEPAEYDRLLGLDRQGYTTAVVVTAGYRSANDKYAGLKKVRFDAAELIKHV